MDDNTAILTISVKDIQQVASDYLDRELNQKELEYIKDHIDEYISWYDEVEACINNMPESHEGD